ncbi:MAG: DUF5711 family protein [Lachnospiraceae bacterium]|nr:DUF5711 family protein [Lachnospiraceae bacterium]
MEIRKSVVNIRAYEKKKENNNKKIINKEFINKEMNKDDTLQGSNYSKIILQHRLRTFYRGVLSILLIASVIAALYISNKNKVYTEYQELSSIDRSKVDNAIVENLDGTILTYSNDGANCSDAEGNVLWNQTFEMQNPIVKINKDVIAMADYNGRSIYIMNQAGLLGQVETGMPIRSICVSQSGVVAAVLDDSGVNAIYLYSSDGETIAYFKTTMKKSGYPIAVAISPNSEIVSVSYLYLDSGIVTSNVAFYNFGAVGQNESDNYVSGYSYTDTVVPQLDFMDNSTSFALADGRLIIYKGKQIPTSAAEVLLQNEVQSVFYSADYIGLVYLNTTGESKYSMDVYNNTGKKILTKEFDIDYTDIFFTDGCFVVYNEQECLICNLNGKEKYKGNFKTSVDTLIPTSKISEFITVTPDKITTIELK